MRQPWQSPRRLYKSDSTARTLGTMASAVFWRFWLRYSPSVLPESHGRSQDQSSRRFCFPCCEPPTGASRSGRNQVRADRPFGDRSTSRLLPRQTSNTSEQTSRHGAGCGNLRRLALSPRSPPSPTGAHAQWPDPGSERRCQNAAPSGSRGRASADKTTCARYPRARCQLIE